MRALLFVLAWSCALAVAACSAGTTPSDGGGDAVGVTGTGTTNPTNTGGGFTNGTGGNTGCDITCSPDLHQVIDCMGNVIEQCSGDQGCNAMTGSCTNACDAAVENASSVGCEYYATFMDQIYGDSVCFAAFVANTWDTPAHVTVEYQGQMLNVGSFLYTASGMGPNQIFTPVNPAAGIPPGEIGVLFLSGTSGGIVPCPVPAAITGGSQITAQSGIGSSFRINTDIPVVTYQMNPYGGGSAATTAASLLLPTSVWGTNYVAANAGYSVPEIATNASMNIVAKEDNTTVTMVPVSNIEGGGALPPGPVNTPYTFVLNRGQQAQFTQLAGLMGSIISSDKPVGVMAGNNCHRIPIQAPACDHGEQMVPPISALGSEYVGVMHRPRQGEPAFWFLVGAVDGTQLTWMPDVGGPTTINRGQIVEVITGTPFVVRAQDDAHPFLFFHSMSSCWWDQMPTAGGDCWGDPDWVIGVPPKQYDYRYVFFADPTYPETSLVLVRAKQGDAFADVSLDCLGTVSGWQPVGEYEWARVDLSTGNFLPVGSCSTGRHEISSAAPFGLWVWGWGTPLTTISTQAVSYGFPGGMRVKPINTVVIPPVPQ